VQHSHATGPEGPPIGHSGERDARSIFRKKKKSEVREECGEEQENFITDRRQDWGTALWIATFTKRAVLTLLEQFRAYIAIFVSAIASKSTFRFAKARKLHTKDSVPSVILGSALSADSE
jgi:hypothetical protein